MRGITDETPYFTISFRFLFISDRVRGQGQVIYNKEDGTKTLQGFIFNITETKLEGEESKTLEAELKEICGVTNDAIATMDA
jgi:hypothetical protein